jgi:glycosyltransferase involved in cell wall biosynthesis
MGNAHETVKRFTEMNIAHVTFDMRIGGTEQVIYQLIRHCDASKYQMSIICLEQSIGPFGQQLIDQGFTIHAFNRKPGFDTSLITQIRQYIRQYEIDILHCHQYSPYVYGVLAALGTKAEVIFTEHGRFYPDIRKRKRVLANYCLNKITAQITAISEATRNALAMYENFPLQRIKVIYNGIEPIGMERGRNNHRAEFGIPEQAFVLGTIARLDPIKNHAMMIRALKRVQEQLPETYLVIVGDGPERQAIFDIAHQAGVAEYLVLPGFRTDVQQFYHIFDLFLLTSWSEGTAMTLLEAMCCSLPCIVTKVGGNPEIVTENETGLIVDCNDDRQLAKQILHLLNDSNQRFRMGEQANRRFHDKFTAVIMAMQYERLYNNLKN